MDRPRSTPTRRRYAGLAVGIGLALVIALPSAAPAASVETWQTRLAQDTTRLAVATRDVRSERAELAALQVRHRVLRRTIERRLVAIYKTGGAGRTFTRVAAGGSARDVTTTIDAIGVIAEYDASELRRWKKMTRDLDALEQSIDDLDAEMKDARSDIRRDRDELADAIEQRRAEVAAAQVAAAKMAARPESPIGIRALSPETIAAEQIVATPEADEPASVVQAPAAPAPAESAPRQVAAPGSQRGEASMYHDNFQGERTANGENYDAQSYTAAHPTLPFGTWVKVQGPGGAVSVRINDRGPFVGGRVIDLSSAAADAVGIGGGIGDVTLTVER